MSVACLVCVSCVLVLLMRSLALRLVLQAWVVWPHQLLDRCGIIGPFVFPAVVAPQSEYLGSCDPCPDPLWLYCWSWFVLLPFL